MAVCFQFSPPLCCSSRITTVLPRCEYQPLMPKHKHLICNGPSLDLQGHLKTIPESKHMTKSRSNKNEICRRGLVFHTFWVPLSFLFTGDSGIALDTNKVAEETDYASQMDEINAYTFSYPLRLPKQQSTLKWIESRKPERYSSAAPLSADARQRIVSERLDIKDNLVISVSIGPPNSRFLTSTDKNTWDANNVAESVLSDKSTARLTTGQRVQETSIIDAHGGKVDGEPYWYYEYIVQKSPTLAAQTTDVFRHSLAVTAERDGYLYSLNASALNSSWNMQPSVLSMKFNDEDKL
ncbi:psbP domain-containing protein 5, chloroplastic isoform X2 [Cryptomeria japonica]|uniref:psbP domain-containing protein 5, chloroplastic isoform X2 n=1 Tax=Cryptomeria japonica TaxID=3369 RepID=UPI0027DA6A17|nr:psbP domain-containing protein 5, chloroplastic isoform X2 [Cryptomeria japonica]